MMTCSYCGNSFNDSGPNKEIHCYGAFEGFVRGLGSYLIGGDWICIYCYPEGESGQYCDDLCCRYKRKNYEKTDGKWK